MEILHDCAIAGGTHASTRATVCQLLRSVQFTLYSRLLYDNRVCPKKLPSESGDQLYLKGFFKSAITEWSELYKSLPGTYTNAAQYLWCP